RGEPVPERQQDEQLATWAPEPSEDDCALVWTWTTERLLRRIRALAPSPGAFTEIGDAVVTVRAARSSPRFPRALEPGEAAIVDGRAIVRTKDGAVELVEGEIDGLRLDGPALAAIVARA